MSDVSDNVRRREKVAVRLTPAALARVDTLAADHGWSRSHALRELLRLGLTAWDRGQR